MLLLISIACSYQSGGRIEQQPVTTWTGADVAVVVPEGAAVLWDAGRLKVDAADGSRWFDVRWVVPPEVPEAYTHKWAFDACDTVKWDRPATPVPGTTTMGGTCLLSWRRFWIFAIQETHGDATLVTMYVADSQRVAMEDAWVDLTRTALTSTRGPAPLATTPPAEVRLTMRAAANAGGVGHEPVPGGGELSAAVSERLVPLWESRRAAPPPRF